MIRLAARLTVGGGREAVIRLLLTAAGLALAVTMLLVATVVFPALHNHDVRRAWTQTSAHNQQPAQDESTADPLSWRLTEVRFDGDDVVRVDLAADGPDAPVPPGLAALPGPGELAVSPRLAELLRETEAAELADRFPGRVAATVGRDALASPEDLVVFVGLTPGELRGQPGVETVRSIEAAPISHNLTRAMRIVFAVGAVGLLAPVVVFVATATRLAAARREQRLAALRLTGATSRQVGAIAAFEALVAALAGVAVGLGVFLAVRTRLARVPLDGASFYPSDLRLSVAGTLAVAATVPVLAVVAALVSLRRVRISPLGVTRRAAPARPTARPLLLVLAGLVILVATVVVDRHATAGEMAVAVVMAATFLMMIVGVVLSGPWLTALVARGVARAGRRAPSLLAARRLEDDPSAGFRAISGIVLAVFVGTVFSGIAASVLANDERLDGNALPDGVVATSAREELLPPGAGPETPFPPVTLIAPADVDRLVAELGEIPGVRDVVEVRAAGDDPEVRDAMARTPLGFDPADMFASCDDMAALGFAPCEGTTILHVGSSHVSGTNAPAPIGEDELAALPVAAIAVDTDGHEATLERARTVLEAGLPGARALTRADMDAESREELRTQERVTNIALAVTLVIAGCSLAVAVTGTIVERRQAFAQLRLAGTRLADLRRVVMAEAAAPLLVVAAASVGLGLAVAALVLAAAGSNEQFAVPGTGYWLSLGGGLAVALLVVLATLPLLSRLTDLDAARFE